jgi:triphosphoribosyl-dephospho-CoA synthase
MTQSSAAQNIAKSLQLAVILEVSIQKPGNVGFEASFEETRVEHFLASAVAIGPTLEEAAFRGIRVQEKKLGVGEVGLGELIKACAKEVALWQRGGNTILGTIMLIVPLAVAAGMTYRKEETLNLTMLRRNLKETIASTNACDSVYLYEAVNIANPSGLGKAPSLDVTNPNSKKRLLEENVSLLEVFRLAQDYDDICYEWVNNYDITFDLAYPYLKGQLDNKPLKVAVLNTFLKILATRPDTFIVRKVSKKKAIEASTRAKRILDMGSVETPEGEKELALFDKELRSSGNKCNPGTTADLTAASLALATLSGYRP